MNAGCTVVVESILKRYPDGRFDVLTRGRRRFVIQSLNQDKEYLRGEVDNYSDDDAGSATPEPAQTVAVLALERMRDGLSRVDGASDEDAPESQPDLEHPFLSFQLAEAVDDLDFRNTLQRSRSESERLRVFADFTDEYVARKQYAARMKRAAPLNGFGHKPVIQ